MYRRPLPLSHTISLSGVMTCVNDALYASRHISANITSISAVHQPLCARAPHLFFLLFSFLLQVSLRGTEIFQGLWSFFQPRRHFPMFLWLNDEWRHFLKCVQYERESLKPYQYRHHVTDHIEHSAWP